MTADSERLERERERDKFRRILNSISAGVLYVSSDDGRILDMNPYANALFGLSEEELKGKVLLEFLFDENGQSLMDGRYCKSGKYECRLRSATGKMIDVLVSCDRIEFEGQIYPIYSIMDITTEREAQERLRNVNELLKMVNRILRHDMLNNLMIVIMGLEHYFEDGEDRILDNSMRAARRSVELIGSMKDLENFYMIGTNLREYHLEDVIKVITRNHFIDVDVEGKATVMADEALSSIFDNIISNSIKHGGATRVDIRIMNPDPDRIVVEVEDNGSGIKEKDRDKIFNEGFTTSKSKGMGMGLYLVERTMHRYGGSISVHDGKNGGAIFRLEFPASEKYANHS